eukprot:s583_g2.t1
MAGALAQRIPESAPRMTSQEVSNYLLAVALHDGEDGGLTKIGDQTLLAGVQRLKQLLPKLTKQQLFIHAPTVLWACARAGHRDVDLLTRLANKYQNLAKRLPTWSLLSMAWSFERLGAPGFKEFQEVLRANIEMRGLTRADVELSQKGPLEWAAATKSPRRTSQEEQRKVELQAKLQHMEHKMVQGKQIMEQAIQQEQELKKHEKRLRKQQERETELRQIEEQQRQENLLLEERCASQEEQVVKLTTKLQKLWDKYQKAQQEMVDLQHFNQQEHQDMLSMIRDLRQTLKLKALIMESFVPMKEIQNTQERAAWDAEEDEWRIQPVTLDKENRPKRPNSVMGLPRPTSEFARLNRTMGDSNPRYMYDNIVFTDLDLPERTTEDYEVQPELGDRIERAITLALSHDDDDVKEAKAPTHHTGRCSACEFAPDMAHATRGRSSFRIARAALIALLLAGAPPCMDFFAWPAPGYSRGRPRSTTRWAAETTEPATQSQAEEPRPSDHRLRELRTRVAALRAQMVQQRREINELTKELLKEELLCATRSPEQNGFDRLFRSVGVLIHTAWKNGDPVSFVYNQTGTAIRVAGQTAASGELIRDVLPNAPTLLTVAPGLYAHASRLDRHLPQILSDYGSVSPAAQQIASVPTACIFILAVELCERLAFYTFTGTQALLRSVCLLLFLSEFFLEKTGYSLAQANALTTAMSTLCMAWAVFAGWVADVQLGRFRTIIIFGVVYSIGGLAATVAASPRWMSSGLYLFALLVLVPMGTAGIKSNISNFGADQYDMTDPEQVAAQAQFFQWFYMAINVGSAFAYGFLTTLGTNGGLGISKDACDYGYFAAYFLASVAMAVAVMAFIAVRGRYRTSPLLHTSAMADVCQRVWKELGNGSGMAQACVTGAFLSALAIVLSVVGALMQHQMPGRISDADLPGVSLSPEDARGFLRLLPVIITAQLSCGHPRMQYSFQQQACQMDVRIPFGGEAQFAGSFFMMLGCSIGQTCECCIVSARIADCLGIAIATPVAVGWLNPMLEKKLGRYFSHDGKFVFGMAVGGASVVVAAVLESVRKAARVSDRLSNCAPDGIHMSSVSAVWMFLPFLMMGIGEIYTNPVIMHLVYSSSSAATRTLAVVATLLVQAVSTAIFGVQARGLP